MKTCMRRNRRKAVRIAAFAAVVAVSAAAGILAGCQSTSVGIIGGSGKTDVISEAKDKKEEQKKLDESRVSKAILERESSGQQEGECVAEGHIILGSGTVNGCRELYVLTSSGQYAIRGEGLVKVSGTGVIPVRMTFDNDGKLLEYKMPRDGKDYAWSISEMFPEEYTNRALGEGDDDYAECMRQERVYAEEYLKSIGRGDVKIRQ